MVKRAKYALERFKLERTNALVTEAGAAVTVHELEVAAIITPMLYPALATTS